MRGNIKYYENSEKGKISEIQDKKLINSTNHLFFRLAYTNVLVY